MTHKIKPVFAVKATLALVGLVASLPSWADNPLGLLLSETLTYDSNILKNDKNKVRDLVSATAVKGFLQKDYGRQTYSAAVTGIFQRYKNVKDYNNNGYQLDLGFSSEVGANGVVTLDHQGGRSLQDLGGQGLERYKETITSQSTGLEARYGLYGRWGVSGALSRDVLDYEERNVNDRVVVGARIGLRYTPTDLLFFDVGVKKSDAEQKNLPILYSENGLTVQTVGDKIDRTDVNLITRWVVTGYSSLDAQFGYTRESHDKDTNRDFSGLTGRASWRYTPRGKVSYTLAVDRDTNNAGGYTQNFGLFDINLATRQTQKRLSTGFQFNAIWAATAKISANAGLTFRRIEEETNNEDRLNMRRAATGDYLAASMGLRYAATRALSFNCNVTSYKRDDTTLATGYSGESVACGANFLIN